jgi:hypothetical protein
MMQRCFNPDDRPYWGARGITVCERWRGPDGFANFLADMGERPPGKTIDRIDNDGNYEPSNCRWATPREQAHNRLSTYRIFLPGVTSRPVSLAEISESLGLAKSTILDHARKPGQSVQSVVELAVRRVLGPAEVI